MTTSNPATASPNWNGWPDARNFMDLERSPLWLAREIEVVAAGEGA